MRSLRHWNCTRTLSKDSTLDKLAGMTDAEFEALELYPDFI